MIRLKVSGGNFDPLIQMVERMAHPDLGPLAVALQAVMIQDNREGLLAGLDSFGDRSADVLESTVRRGRGGDGPPLVPRYGASRMIAGYSVEIQQAPDRTLLIGGWADPWVHFHAEHSSRMVARDPVGIRPDGQLKVGSALEDFGRSLIGGQP